MRHLLSSVLAPCLTICLSLSLSAQVDCIGPDFNDDGEIGSSDLIVFLSYYGNDWPAVGEFTCGETISHHDYAYQTVQIGDQCWFAENCRYLPAVSPSSVGSTTVPYYYVYNYQGTDVEEAKANSSYDNYGVLYNWPAAMDPGTCPSGWHTSTDEEWMILEMFLGMSESEANSSGYRGTDEGDQMKSISGWNNNGNGTNSSGLNVFGGGYRGYLAGSIFYARFISGFLWSSSDVQSNTVWYRQLYFFTDDVNRDDNLSRQDGLSVRCVID